MYTIKRMIAYLFIFLFVISLYKDITSGTSINNINTPLNKFTDGNFEIISIPVGHGDTVLSIIENLNSHAIDIVNINDMLMDFKKINPSVDPYNLSTNKIYNFPLYVE